METISHKIKERREDPIYLCFYTALIASIWSLLEFIKHFKTIAYSHLYIQSI